MQKSTTQKLAVMGMLAAISIVLVSLIHLPILPAVAFLEYDPADIPILIGTFAFGPLSGLALTVVVSVIQGVTVSAASGWIGILMHIFATGSFALVAGTLYKRRKTKGGAVLALTLGAATMVVTMVLWNLIFTPLFLGMPLAAVMELLPWIALFNVMKAAGNAIVSFVVYKAVHKAIHRLFHV